MVIFGFNLSKNPYVKTVRTPETGISDSYDGKRMVEVVQNPQTDILDSILSMYIYMFIYSEYYTVCNYAIIKSTQIIYFLLAEILIKVNIDICLRKDLL